MAFNLDTEISAYYTKLSGDVRERYDEKIRQCGGVDPYTIKPKDLSTIPMDFPKITLSDIEDYMINSVSSFTKQFLDNYKGTEAYTYFESGFVLNVGSKKNNISAIVKGKVKHSQRMNESPLQPWILANLNGKIMCAHCTCVAGLSETCSHVGAICFAINKIVESRETESVTDVLCKWNVPSFKDVSMSSATDINWRFRSHEPMMLESTFLEYCNSVPHLTNARVNQFVVKSHSDGDDTALGTILFSSKKKRKTAVRDEIFLSSLYNENYRSKSLRDLIEIGRAIQLNLSSEEVKEISSLTLPRLKSKCSTGLRRGRITGSNFKNCCLTNIQDPSVTTIRRVINRIKNFDHVPSIKYQIQNKKKAIQQYARVTLLEHADFVYSECGILINPNLPYFAGSPDGLVSCSCHGDGCVEIKCLNIQESDALEEFLTRKPNNMLNKYVNRYSLEENHEFFYQVQLQINLNDLKYCDCVIWSPQKAFTVRVNADTDFWKVALEKGITFHEHVLMPELLGKYFTNKDLHNSTEHIDESLEVIALEIELLDSIEE